MADNSAPESYEPLVQHLTDAADGAHTHGATLELTRNDEPHIRTDLENLTGTSAGPGGNPPAKPGLKQLWNIADAHKCAMTAALRTVCSNARFLVRTCIRSLMPLLGERWNTNWKNAGFSGGSLHVPDHPLVMLQQLSAYYTGNPTREVTIQGVACTAANCTATIQALEAADAASNQSNTDAGTAHNNFLNGIQAGRDRLSALRQELEQAMDDDDERWYAFGFDKPSDPNTPAVPANLTVVAGAPGSKMLLANWDDARRALNYRIRAVLKTGGPEVLNEIAPGTQFGLALTTLASGTVVVITVSARNATGESQPGNAVEMAVP